jgi:hypothetical protein
MGKKLWLKLLRKVHFKKPGVVLSFGGAATSVEERAWVPFENWAPRSEGLTPPICPRAHPTQGTESAALEGTCSGKPTGKTPRRFQAVEPVAGAADPAQQALAFRVGDVVAMKRP